MSTKQLIIQAASRLFAEKGYEGMTMKEIAKEVGIKAPSLYAFFESKEQLFLEIYRNVITNHLHLVALEADSTHLTVKEQLEHMLRTIMEFQLKESLAIKIYMRLLLFPPEVFRDDMKAEVAKLEKAEHEMFYRIFQRGVDNGEIKQMDCSSLATSLICMLDGLFWAMQRDQTDSFWKRFQTVWEQFWLHIQNN